MVPVRITVTGPLPLATPAVVSLVVGTAVGTLVHAPGTSGTEGAKVPLTRPWSSCSSASSSTRSSTAAANAPARSRNQPTSPTTHPRPPCSRLPQPERTQAIADRSPNRQILTWASSQERCRDGIADPGGAGSAGRDLVPRHRRGHPDQGELERRGYLRPARI